MENNETNVRAIELQKHIQKLDKLERMINPNSKKAMILWEEDDAFKKLIADYASKAARAMALKSYGAASAWGSYQPKEPECLKKISKQK